MKMLAITLRLLQQRLHDAGMGNESALVARMARDAETIGHVNIAEHLARFDVKREPQPGDVDFDGTSAAAEKRQEEEKHVD